MPQVSLRKHSSHMTTPDQAQLMHELAEILPRQGTWRADDYLWLTERTNRLIELADGQLEILPMPTEQHQRIVLALYRLIYAFLLQHVGGVLLVVPLRLRLAAQCFREPDLLYLRAADDARRGNDYWDGADLVIEVVSPGNAHLDLVTKRHEYAENGIAEYWIVHPQDETITVLALRDGTYHEHGIFRPGAAVSSPLLPGLSIAVADVLHSRA